MHIYLRTLIFLIICLIGSRSVASAADSTLPFLAKGSTVVFIGDSITDGGRQRTGNDFNHTMGQSYAYLLAATLGNQLAERDLTCLNRGIGGNRISDLQNRWQNDVIALKPDLLSILIGINDTFSGHGETTEQFEQIYDTLLRDTLLALPKIKIVLGEPFVLAVGKYRDSYPTARVEVAQRQAAVARLAARYRLPLIHYQAVFDAALQRAPADHWLWDGIHPHYAGHGLMAAEWLKIVDSAWR